MNIAVVYVYPKDGADGFLELAGRFMNSYHRCPPGLDHQTIVACQPGSDASGVAYLFDSLPNVRLLAHDNSGYDIGAFQRAAREVPCDLMVFFGATAYLKCPGWLIRMVESFAKNGDTLYGAMGNRGVPHVGVQPHIRTTGFWMTPQLLNAYPMRVMQPEQRYGFEHGANCLTSWISRQGKIPWVVAYDGEYQSPFWDSIPNGYHSGDQSNLLVGDRLTMPPYYHIE